MEITSNQTVANQKAKRLADIRKALDLNQEQMGARLLTGQSNIGKFENGKRPIGPNVEYKILHEFNINPTWWQTGVGEMFNPPQQEKNAKLLETDSNSYEVLTYISTKARASFMELLDVTVEFEAYRVFKDNPDDNYADQVVFEIGGDSMEPNYWDGCKVRCKEVKAGDWVYLNSGVYAVAYANFFVVKRVKNSPSDGVLILHSDNVQTGGSIEVPLSKVRKIWRVLRIVDAPAR